ncbi:MAG: glycosyltransferase family 2 protein [Clostridia bacterium]|nr:glycosyltransferase family 2 protein [Clostridia bacterium]
MDKKICVYAIAKNEIKFVDRWYNSVKEADYICVLDTGSTDGTFEKLSSLGVITKQKKYKNFRFDVARNDSMKLIPDDTDICVCIDLDEFFVSGWSTLLKQNWKEDTTRARYRYTWNFNPDGTEGVVFMLDKIHKNKMYNWTHPVHETLTNTTKDKEIFIEIPNIQLNHRADNTKSRSNYLPLLELSVKEYPSDDRNMHYLGREYMFYGMYDDAIKTLKKHLELPKAVWNLERSASLRYIANCYKMKNDKINQEKYLLLAILEANYTREAYYDLAIFYFENKEYLKSAYTFNEMLKITNRTLNYMSAPHCWNFSAYDYLSLCYYEIGNYKKAIDTINIAILFNPKDNRLKENKQYFIKKLNNL